jgi:lysophospholipase L1-like esterase
MLVTLTNGQRHIRFPLKPINCFTFCLHFHYIDYYSSLVDENKGMKKEYSSDGVHPNKDGYLVMEKIAEPAIRKEVGKS